MLIRRRGQRQARHARKGIHHRAQQAVIWAEIMPPLRYAMRLVDGEKADVGLFQHVAEMRLAGPFRRDIEQVQIAIDQGTDGCPRSMSALVRLAARMPLARALRNWSCISAMRGLITTQVPGSMVAGN
jgi:hypothetical protein